jgi:hypothetical protein
MRPPHTEGMNRDIVRAEMVRLGAMSRAEVGTAVVISTAVLAWALQPWHGIPPEAIGMIALAAMFGVGILQPADIGPGIPWALAIFVGGMLSMTTVMNAYKINAWLSGYIVPAVQPFAQSPFLLVLAIAAAVALMRFVDPVGFITIAAFVLSLAEFAASRDIPPLVLTAMVLLPVHVFWFSYQNIWLAMTDGISKKTAYTEGDRLRLATAFLGTTIVALWLGVGYWYLIGVIG